MKFIYRFPKKNVFYDLIVFASVTCFLVYRSLTHFISHSEFWAISTAKLFGTLELGAAITYSKPLFYLMLKTHYLFDLENVTHIYLARSLFGLTAMLILFIWYRIGIALTGNRVASSLYSLFLLSFHVIYTQIFRVRSDLLATLFISLAIYVLVLMIKQNSSSLKKQTLFLVCSWAALLCTPKAFLVSPIFLMLVLLYAKDLTQKRSTAQALRHLAKPKYFLVSLACLLLPVVFLAVAVEVGRQWLGPGRNPYTHAFYFFSKSFHLLYEKTAWDALFISFKVNYLQYGVVLLGALTTYIRFPQWRRLLIVPVWLSFVILFFPEKWEYFIASLLPIICFPAIFFFNELIRKGRVITCAVVSLCLWLPGYMTYFSTWQISNGLQMQTVRDLNWLMEQSKNHIYFDSLGLLPRHPMIGLYVGPGDSYGQHGAFNYVKSHPPTFIFYSEKISHAASLFRPFLLINYQPISIDLWVHKRETQLISDLKAKIAKQPIKGNIERVFIYDHRPNTRF